MKKLRRILFCTPDGGTRGEYALCWLISLVYIGVFSIAIGIVSLYFAKVNYGPELFSSYFHYLGIFLLNVVPGFVLALIMLCIFNRVWAAVLASGVIVTVLALINHYKLMFRDDPLLASDAGSFLEAAQISSRYNIVVTPAIVLAFLGVIAASVFAFFFMRARFRRALPRLGTLAALLALCAGLYAGVYTSDAVYKFTSNLAVEFASGYKMNQWNETDNYCCRGFMYPLIRSFKDLKNDKPDGYNRREAEALVSSRADSDIAEDKKVNFISVMLEAYYDFSTYSDIFTFETDPYAFYHELQSESVHGELVTNIFAGGTIDTERCYVTGSTEMYEYRHAADSYARYFANRGYFTEFCHPGYGWFYNRQNVMEYLGFERTNFFEGRYQMPEGVSIMRDDSFFPDLLYLYESAVAEGRPYFNMSVTYQNHGPYAGGYLYDEENEYIPRAALSEESYNILNNYFWGIKLTDDSLRDFVSSLRESEEPVVLVLFGDHKPWLGDNSTVYSELGIDLSRSTDESFYNYYETQYIIWANDAAKKALGNDFSGYGGSFSPCFLMMKLFDLCSYEGDSYMDALREVYAAGVDVVSSGGRYRENGVLTDELSDSAQDSLDKLLMMQYYRMHDWEG